jgi:protein-L-isoaspartate(D-aspartate) O-methyltransferase
MSDTPELAGRRRALVQRLDIHDPEVRRAMLAVPRHDFLPTSRVNEAYWDEPVPLGPSGATISAPHMVVLLAEAAALRPGDRVLEVGAGMGYLAAVLAEIVGPEGHVVAVEIEPSLAAEARRRFDSCGRGDRVEVYAGDGARGWPSRAPFDAIVVSFAVPRLYPTWKSQLSEHGRLVAPVGDAWEQRLTTFTREGGGGHTVLGPRCRFVPQRGGTPAPI